MQQAFWTKKLLFEFAPDEIIFFNQNNKRLRLILTDGRNMECCLVQQNAPNLS